MKILVTGGSGMVGRYLQSISHEYPHLWFFLSSRDYDLTDKSQVEACFQKYQPDFVIHLAANVGGIYKNIREQVNMFRSNLLMNQYVVDACHQHNIQRAIFCLSTCIFPENPPNGFPLKEEDLNAGPPHPSNESYAYAKRMLYVQCHNYNRQFNREYICLAPTNLYGKWDNFHLEDSHVIPALIHKMWIALKNGTPMEILGTGTAIRQFLYTGDFAKMICQILFSNSKSIPDLIICSGPTELSINDIVQCLIEIFRTRTNGCLSIQYNFDFSDGIPKKTASNARLVSILNPSFTDFYSSLEQSVEWFIENYETLRK